MNNILNKVTELAFLDELNKLAAVPVFETAMGQKAVAPVKAAITAPAKQAPVQNTVTSKQQVYSNVNKAMGANAPRPTNVVSKQQVYANASKAMGNYAPSNMSQYRDVRKHGVNFLNEMENSAAASYKKTIPQAVSGQAAAPAPAPNEYDMAAKKFKGGSQFKDINQAILVRNKAARGSNEWNMAQNAINSAYGYGPQRQAQAMPAGTGARVLSRREPGSTMTVANFTIGDIARQNAQTVKPVPQQAPVQTAAR